jgi:RecJ-like exonuclease
MPSTDDQIERLIERGFGYERTLRLFGEVYETDGEDLRERATLLNAVGKYGNGETAVAMCLNGTFDNDRLRQEHRDQIRRAIAYAKCNLTEYNGFYYFHGGGEIRDTLVGTVAGMLLRNEELAAPLLAFAENGDGIKVSARAPACLVKNGLSLSKIMRTVSRSLGGDGGGHRAAAGAHIPKGSECQFLCLFERELRHQLAG